MPLFGQSVEHTRTQFPSGDAQVTLDSFVPKRPGRYPAVIGLHGSGGILDEYLAPAAQLAGSGYTVFLPHYFDRTGDLWPDKSAMHRDFPVWMELIGSALDLVVSHPATDPSRIALLGFSLGAYLALSIAGHDARIKAVVEYFGGLPEQLNHTIQRMPPVLILHGEADPKVPVSEARTLEAALKQHGRPYEIKLYPNAGHGFSGFTRIDSAQRTLSFLKKHLK